MVPTSLRPRLLLCNFGTPPAATGPNGDVGVSVRWPGDRGSRALPLVYWSPTRTRPLLGAIEGAPRTRLRSRPPPVECASSLRPMVTGARWHRNGRASRLRARRGSVRPSGSEEQWLARVLPTRSAPSSMSATRARRCRVARWPTSRGRSAALERTVWQIAKAGRSTATAHVCPPAVVVCRGWGAQTATQRRSRRRPDRAGG